MNEPEFGKPQGKGGESQTGRPGDAQHLFLQVPADNEKIQGPGASRALVRTLLLEVPDAEGHLKCMRKGAKWRRPPQIEHCTT